MGKEYGDHWGGKYSGSTVPVAAGYSEFRVGCFISGDPEFIQL